MVERAALTIARCDWSIVEQDTFRELLWQFIRSALRLREPPRLAHYTTLSGLQGIVRSGVILANNTNNQTDETELEFSRHAICRGVLSAPQIHRRDDFRKVIVAQMGDPPLDIHAFAASFSGDDDLATQWCDYGDRGRGYAITIDPEQVNPKMKVMALQVVYDRGEQDGITHNLISSLEEAIYRTLQTTAAVDQQKWNDFLGDVIAMLHIPLAQAFKSDDYQSENEWRYVYLEFDGQAHAKLPIVGTDRASRRAIQLAAAHTRSPIIGVRCGPRTSDHEVSSTRALLAEAGLADVMVYRSRHHASELCDFKSKCRNKALVD